MMSTTFTAVQWAAIVASVLVVGVAALQVALAFGAPLGDAVLGGRAPTHNGVLAGRFRVLAALQAVILVLIAWVLLARTGVVTNPLFSGDTLVWLAWVIVAFFALNTLANFSAPHAVERWVMGSITLTTSALGLFIALTA